MRHGCFPLPSGKPNSATGAVTATYETDEWGIPTAGTGGSSQPLGFTGEPRDGTGLTYLRTRYYDPDLGRYLSRDTWPGSPAVPQSQNRSAYVANNPTSETDPSGRFLDSLADAAFIVYDVGSLVFGPEKERGANLVALGADVGSLFLPFVTGGGWLARGGIEATEHVDDAIGGIRWLEDAAKSACSFTAETLVATLDGPVPISSIAVGDIVLAWDEATGAIVERPVTAVLPHPDDEIARVTLDGLVLTTTPDHPFYTVERGWVEAGLLWPGARVVSTSGTAVVADVDNRAVPWDAVGPDCGRRPHVLRRRGRMARPQPPGVDSPIRFIQRSQCHRSSRYRVWCRSPPARRLCRRAEAGHGQAR